MKKFIETTFGVVGGIGFLWAAFAIFVWDVGKLQQARDSRDWPQVEGRVTHSAVDHRGRERRPHVVYTYAVAGTPYTSSQISFDVFDNPGGEGRIDTIIARYPVGTEGYRLLRSQGTGNGRPRAGSLLALPDTAFVQCPFLLRRLAGPLERVPPNPPRAGGAATGHDQGPSHRGHGDGVCADLRGTRPGFVRLCRPRHLRQGFRRTSPRDAQPPFRARSSNIALSPDALGVLALDAADFSGLGRW